MLMSRCTDARILWTCSSSTVHEIFLLWISQLNNILLVGGLSYSIAAVVIEDKVILQRKVVDGRLALLKVVRWSMLIKYL